MVINLTCEVPFCYKSQPVASAPVFRDFQFKDESRNKNLKVRVGWPNTTGNTKLPIIILSHLALGGGACYENFVRYFICQGYLVIQPTHKDCVKEQREERGFGFLVKEKPKKFIQKIYSNPFFWKDRIADIHLCLTKLSSLNEKVAELKNRLAFDKICIAGHSFGAYTALLAAGLRVNLPPELQTPPYKPTQTPSFDPKVPLFNWTPPCPIQCFICISPQGPGEFGIVEESYSSLSAPILFMTSNKDHSLGEIHQSDWKRKAFDLSKEDEFDKYLVFFYEADHGYGDLAGVPIVSLAAGWSSDIPTQSLVTMMCNAFVDKYLKNKPTASQFLDGNLISDCFNNFGFIEKKAMPKNQNPPPKQTTLFSSPNPLEQQQQYAPNPNQPYPNTAYYSPQYGSNNNLSSPQLQRQAQAPQFQSPPSPAQYGSQGQLPPGQYPPQYYPQQYQQNYPPPSGYPAQQYNQQTPSPYSSYTSQLPQQIPQQQGQFPPGYPQQIPQQSQGQLPPGYPPQQLQSQLSQGQLPPGYPPLQPQQYNQQTPSPYSSYTSQLPQQIPQQPQGQLPPGYPPQQIPQQQSQGQLSPGYPPQQLQSQLSQGQLPPGYPPQQPQPPGQLPPGYPPQQNLQNPSSRYSIPDAEKPPPSVKIDDKQGL